MEDGVQTSVIYNDRIHLLNVSSSPSCSSYSNISNSSSPDVTAGKNVIVLLWQICGPILLLIGYVGNVLVLITMTRRRMRGTSTFVYLVGMASIDLVVLTVGLLPAWLEGASFYSIKVNNRLCMHHFRVS
jgi:hypothetical protein